MEEVSSAARALLRRPVYSLLAASRRDVVDTLKTGSADGEGAPRRIGRWRVPGVRDLMVSAQVGLSIVLLVLARLVVRRVVASVALGLAGGLVASLALAGLVRSLLFGVGATDPASIVAAAGVFLVAALVAALVPAHRAASVDPMRSLRTE